MSTESQAVVIGGGIAGLCAAAALARRFDRVVVLETHAASSDARAHSPPLAWRGQRALARLLPSALLRLEADGVVRADIGALMRWFVGGEWTPPQALGLETTGLSRATLEQRVRESCAELDNVEIRRDVAVAGPVQRWRRVRGVELYDGQLVKAELVVDASDGARSPDWLRSLGVARIAEQAVELGLTVVSGVFELPAGESLDAGLAIHPLETRRGGAMVAPIEDGRVSVTLFGYHGDAPPAELDELCRWARALPHAAIAELLARARLVGALDRRTHARQVRRQLGASLGLPRGYLVVGEALCSIDPILGHDVAVAAMQAELLLELEPGAGTRRWQRKLARVAAAAWKLGASEARCGRSPLAWVRRWCVDQLLTQAARDAEIQARFVRVIHLVDAPRRMLAPAMLRRCVGGYLGRRKVAVQEPRALTMGIPEYVLETHYSSGHR